MSSPADIAAAFDTATEAARTRIVKILAHYDPGRLGEVDALVAAAKRSQIGSADAAIAQLTRQYGPEPGARGGEATVAIGKPSCSASGVQIFATVRASETAIPRWSFAGGNTFHCVPIGLDSLMSLGVVRTYVVDEAPDNMTLCLELLPGAVAPQKQYTVWLSVVDHGGVTASDCCTFIADI